VQVAIGDAFGETAFRMPGGFRVEVEIDFANPVIGQQSYSLDLGPEAVPPGSQPRPPLLAA